jgi:two-component system OmpR family sensor kinase
VNPLGLRVRLALVFTAGFAVLLGLGALGIYIYLARGYRRDFDHALMDAGRGARALFRQDRSEFATSPQTLSHIITELVYGDRTIVAYDSTGTFLGASQRIPDEPYFNDVPHDGPRDRPVPVLLRDGPARAIRVPFENGVELVIAMSTLPLERRLVRLTRALATILPVILVLGALIGAWAARLVLRPIIRVAESTERIGNEVARGAVRFDRLPPHPAGDEITTLTDAFNRLVDRLSAALERERAIVERQRQFLADAAHELRTPVAILRSEAEVTLRGNGTITDYRTAMEQIAIEAEELGLLVADLMLVARGDAQVMAPSRKRVYLDDILHQVIARARVLPGAAGHELRQGDFEAAPVDGDAILLERALLVLVHNAMLHAPGSPIEVSTGSTTTPDGSFSWASVRDFGPGIPADQRERIFERFARINTGAPGTGLGLAIARAIAEAHGGTLTLDEVAPGASFTLRLPQASSGA